MYLKMVLKSNVQKIVFVNTAQYHNCFSRIHTVRLHGSLLFIVTVDFAAVTAFFFFFVHQNRGMHYKGSFAPAF